MMSEEKANQKERVKISADRIRKYFPKDYTTAQIEDRGTPMKNTVKVDRKEVELFPELLTSFAKFLVPEIHKFYQSDEGKAYYNEWLKKHPEYAA